MTESFPPPPAEDPRDFAPDAYGPIAMGALLERANKTISDLASTNRQLWAEARADALTGLPNRRQLYEDLARLSESTPGEFGVLFIDLDKLKEVNDSHGHAAGNELIRTASAVLQRNTRHRTAAGYPDRPHDIVGEAAYRLSGDEFVVIVKSKESGTSLPQEEVNAAAQRIMHELALAGVPGSGAGIPHRPGQSTESLIDTADKYMYVTKLRRKIESLSEEDKRLIVYACDLLVSHEISLREAVSVYPVLKDEALHAPHGLE